MPTPLRTPRRAAALAAVALTATLASPARTAGAQATTFTDRSAFAAMLAPGATTIDFANAIPANQSSGPLPGSIAGATFTSTGNGPIQVIRENYIYGLATAPNLAAFGGATSGFTIDFGGAVTAFGLDVSSVTPGTAFRLALSNGFTATFTQGGVVRPAAFFGVVDATPFTAATLTADVSASLYDDVTFGAVAPASTVTPEPATLALLAPALLGVAAARRRRAR